LDLARSPTPSITALICKGTAASVSVVAFTLTTYMTERSSRA
jgi:hypothetical protein